MEDTFYYSIASSSSGNCSLYISQNTCILIDLGVSVRRLNTALKALGLAIPDIHAVLLTHEHGDHVKGLATFVKHYNIPIYATHGTAKALIAQNPAAEKLLHPFWAGDGFSIGTIGVQPFPTPHDAADSTGYVLQSASHTFGFATDLGFVPSTIRKILHGCDTVVLESNHDPDMLRYGPYPWPLKQRISGRQGHLSNPDCAAFAAELAQNGTSTIILAHLSESNNTPVKALRAACAALDGLPCEVFVAPKTQMDKPIRLPIKEKLCSISV